MPPLAIGRRISYRPTRSGTPAEVRTTDALTAGSPPQRTTPSVLAFPGVRGASLLVFVAAAGLCGCTYDIPGLATDAGSRDAASVEASATGDAGADAGATDGTTPQGDGAAGPTVYSDLGDTSKWQVFDTAPVTGGTGESFGGGSFDGRYVYLAPSTGATSY